MFDKFNCTKNKVNKVNSDFQLMGKTVMISLMKSQFEYFADLDAEWPEFAYIQFDKISEGLAYLDDYDNMHELYHGIFGGKEVCLYHVNEGRSCSIDILK